uniref:Uncharacterized protein n=1 Tax=Sphaerodactylus townsendi TaxID=933632 RepID=A0ACB8FNN1_9SAUR
MLGVGAQGRQVGGITMETSADFKETSPGGNTQRAPLSYITLQALGKIHVVIKTGGETLSCHPESKIFCGGSWWKEALLPYLE